MGDWPDPVRVSPFIKFARWSFLIAGIIYGSMRQKFLATREVHIRKDEARKKAIRDSKLAEERKIASERDVEMIGRMIDPDAYKTFVFKDIVEEQSCGCAAVAPSVDSDLDC